jgi:hypothetical protein
VLDCWARLTLAPPKRANLPVAEPPLVRGLFLFSSIRNYATCDSLTHVRAGDAVIPRKPKKRRASPAVRVQYGALPYRFTDDAALEVLLLTARRSKRWIIPKGWPIKGLRPAKSAAREAFEEQA